MAIAGVVMALLLAAGGVVLAQQRSRVSDLEARLDMARAQSEQERSERGRVALEVDEQEGQVQLLRGRLERAERRERDQQSCISMLSDERSVGEQTVTFGFVTGVDDSSLRFAPAEWFVGDEALEALEERRVIYLEDEHVFLVFNHGKPLALSDDAQHIGDRVEFCESSQMFESAAHGEKFDLCGYYYGGPGRRGLDRYPVRIEGDAVNVDLYEPIPGPGRGDPPALGPAGPLCFP